MQTTCLDEAIRKKTDISLSHPTLKPQQKKELHHFTTMKPQKK